jgi:hypothetical protein
VLIVVSFSTLEPTEAGLRYNGVTINVGADNQLWTAGRHFLGVGHWFVKYPTTQQSVKFQGDNAIVARTRNGLDVTLDVSFNFRLKITLTDLRNLYYSFGEMEAVSTVYNRIARNVVRTVSSEYDAFAFFFNRTTVETKMNVRLQTQLDRFHGLLDSFQLLDVKLPERFAEARVRQLNAVQEKEAAANEKRVAQISADTRVNKTAIEVQSILIEANKVAEQLRIAASADINQFTKRLSAEQTGYLEIKNQLGLTEDELLGYIYVTALQSARASGKRITMRIPDSSFRPFA